jgi:CBS domain-containing protein
MPRYGADYGHDYDAWGGNPQRGEVNPRGGYAGRDGWYGGGSYGYGGARGGSPGYQEGYGYEEWGGRGDEFTGRGSGVDPSRHGGYGTGGGYRSSHGSYGSEMEFGGRGRDEGRFPGGYRSGGARPYEGGYQAGGYDAGYGGGYGGYEGGYGGEMGGGRQMHGRSGSRASEIMTENPEVVTPDATLADAAAKMRDLDVGIIPVVESMENRRLRGVITDRDIAIRAVAEGKDGQSKVSECMTPGVETVNKNDGIERVLGLMEREQVRRVPVTDREGRIVGIIAQADLAVDYGGGRPRASRQVQQTIERISEPARPERASEGMRAGSAIGRGGTDQKQAGQTEERPNR